MSIPKTRTEIRFLRWADDILLICTDTAQLSKHRATCAELLTGNGLPINMEKTYSDTATAELRAGQRLEYLGLSLSLDGHGNLAFDVTRNALGSLLTQVYRDITEQRPNANWNTGLREFYQRQIEFTIGSWLEHHAAGIPENAWKEVRTFIKTAFMDGKGTLGSLLTHYPISCPTSSSLNELYARAREHWHWRYNSPIPSIHERLGIATQRNAQPHESLNLKVEHGLNDGADLWPAPSVIVEPYGNRKPGPDEVDWRVALTPVPAAQTEVNGGLDER